MEIKASGALKLVQENHTKMSLYSALDKSLEKQSKSSLSFIPIPRNHLKKSQAIISPSVQILSSDSSLSIPKQDKFIHTFEIPPECIHSKSCQKRQWRSVLSDEYNPFKPNEYESFKDELHSSQVSLKLPKKVYNSKQSETRVMEPISTNAMTILKDDSGEDAYQRRLRMSMQ